VWAGEESCLDGSLSWSAHGLPLTYEWRFGDGTESTGAQARVSYPAAGVYSEVLKVTDSEGRAAYDFAVVQVADRQRPEVRSPSIHAAYFPTFNIKPGMPLTFKVRTFGTTHGCETWGFGDGSPRVETRSDGNVDKHAPDGYAETEHAFSAPGDYIVTVHRENEHGLRATTRLHVPVSGK
jgi:hypothetical protein